MEEKYDRVSGRDLVPQSDWSELNQMPLET